MTRKHLLDLNVLIALAEPAHVHHHQAHQWFNSSGKSGWGVCPLTEAGFVRVTTNPAFRPLTRSMGQARAILKMLKVHPGYSFWEIDESWVTLTAPFAARISGHLQVTDAYLLGLAIKRNGVLLTFDKAIEKLAGAEFKKHVLVLE
ncbi:MAG: TA system VapC family ribonuclease toxin [Terracidiphilus sp.]